MPFSSFFFLFGAGVVTGALGALLGIGGGLFLVPFLVIVFGLPIHQAIATSIVAVIATSSAGATMNLERRTVNLRLGMVLEIATVVGAIAGGLTASRVSATILTKLFGVVLLIVAVLMMRKLRKPGTTERVSTEGVLHATFHDEAAGQTVVYSVRHMPALLSVSLLAGNLSGLLGVGGGFFKVPAMTILGGVPMKAATATSNFMIGVTAAASAFIYFANGHLNPFIASASVLGVLSGSFFGVTLGRRIHSSALTWIFALVLIGASVQLFLK